MYELNKSEEQLDARKLHGTNNSIRETMRRKCGQAFSSDMT